MYVKDTSNPRSLASFFQYFVVSMETDRAASSSASFSQSTMVVHPVADIRTVSYQMRSVSLTLLGARWDIQGISTILNPFLDEILSHVLQSEGLVDTSGLVSRLGLLHPVVVDIPGQVGVDAGTAAAIVVSGKALVLSEEGAGFDELLTEPSQWEMRMPGVHR